MRMDYIEFDTTPVDEPCVGINGDMTEAKAEAYRMKELLEKRFPDVNGYFTIKSMPHDFGSYLEMRFYYDDEEDGIKEMQHVEANYPQTWQDTEPVLLYPKKD